MPKPTDVAQDVVHGLEGLPVCSLEMPRACLGRRRELLSPGIAHFLLVSRVLTRILCLPWGWGTEAGRGLHRP